MKSIKVWVFRHWPLRMFALALFRPRQFLLEFIYSFVDFWRFQRSLRGFQTHLKRVETFNPCFDRPGLLVVAGRSMSAHWCQIWSILGAVYQCKQYATFVLTSKSRPIQNLYFGLFGFEHLYIENLAIASVVIPEAVSVEFDKLKSFQDFKDFALDGIPLGKMAISTYSRLRATGVMDIDDRGAKEDIRAWLAYLYRTRVVAERLYKRYNIGMLFFTEVFMEEYGAFYYAALNRDLNIIRFAGTVRDDAVVVQHLNRESDRTHFSSLSKKSWARILEYPDTPVMEEELRQNFLDRYGERWAFSKRNQPNTHILPPSEARAILGVPEGRKIAVIYSHILYDTLFFNGEDLFQSYADWLVETVKAACRNPRVQWFIKVHPSNLWRGELEYFHGGKYEEVRLIERYVGDLPVHVQLVYPDTPISPYTWLQIADFGITVRGTSGIELGALGKTVITAGTGRFEGIGFTINPNARVDYLDLLARVPEVMTPTEKQVRLGKRFAYATFCMKPFTLDFFRPVPRAGKTAIFGSDDLVFLGNFQNELKVLPASITRFVEWSFDRNSIDFLNDWPSATVYSDSMTNQLSKGNFSIVDEGSASRSQDESSHETVQTPDFRPGILGGQASS